MLTEFVEGETYQNDITKDMMMILGVYEENDDDVLLAVLKVDPVTKRADSPDEMVMPREDIGNWRHVIL